LKEASKSNLEDTRNDINRVYNFVQWFLAALVALALGVWGLTKKK